MNKPNIFFNVSQQLINILSFFLFFFPFLVIPWHLGFPDQESELGHRCNYAEAAATQIL